MAELQRETSSSSALKTYTDATTDRRFNCVHEQVRQLAQGLLDGVGTESPHDDECVRLLHHEVDFLHEILKRFPATGDKIDLAQSEMSLTQGGLNPINDVLQELRLLREMELPTSLYFAITSLQLLVDGVSTRQTEPKRDLAYMLKHYPHSD